MKTFTITTLSLFFLLTLLIQAMEKISEKRLASLVMAQANNKKRKLSKPILYDQSEQKKQKVETPIFSEEINEPICINENLFNTTFDQLYPNTIELEKEQIHQLFSQFQWQQSQEQLFEDQTLVDNSQLPLSTIEKPFTCQYCGKSFNNKK
jgi:hypothetical protein